MHAANQTVWLKMPPNQLATGMLHSACQRQRAETLVMHVVWELLKGRGQRVVQAALGRAALKQIRRTRHRTRIGQSELAMELHEVKFRVDRSGKRFQDV